MQLMRARLTPWERELHTLLNDAHRAYRTAVAKLPESGLARVFAADFFRCFFSSHYLEIAALHAASTISSAIDVRFLVFQRTKQL